MSSRAVRRASWRARPPLPFPPGGRRPGPASGQPPGSQPTGGPVPRPHARGPRPTAPGPAPVAAAAPALLGPEALQQAGKDGHWLVGLRNRRAFAAEHLVGSVSVGIDGPFAAYLP